MKDFELRILNTLPELRTADGVTRLVGYAAVFDELSANLGGFKERIKPGAFKRVLNRDDEVYAFYNHDPNQLLATRSAGTLRVEEDSHGLRYELDLDPTDPDHQRVISKVKRGDLRGSSFGFIATPDKVEWDYNGDLPERIVGEVAALRDVGPGTMPAYAATEKENRKLALRTLADQIDRPLDELLDAPDLKAFLQRTAEETTEPADTASTNDVVSPETRVEIPPAPPAEPDWYTQYKE